MPPEPLPWDRKDLVFRDRKHEKGSGSDALGGVGPASSSAPRWREPYHPPRDFLRRPPPGHYRQGGGYHQLYAEESSDGRGCTLSRPSDRFWPEDENSRLSSGRYSGGSRSIGSVGRDGRGSLRRSPYRDSANLSRQQHNEAPPPPAPPPVTGLRSVAVPITSPLPLKDHHDNKSGDGGANDDAGTGRGTDPEHDLGSISWKPLKWSRPGSLSLSKTARSETDESGIDALVPSGKETPVRFPAESTPMAEEGHGRKKQRLGWGEGLAKYEKKVEGSEDGSGKIGLVQCSNSTKSVLSDTSPKIMGLAGSSSPATPSSVACSSSPCMEDKPFTKLANVDNDTSHCSGPSCLGTQNYSEESILNSLLADLLQPEDACYGDSSFTRHTAMSKLFLLKGDIAKQLETTENEIDLLESELKSLNCNEEIDLRQASFEMQADKVSESRGETADGSLKICHSVDHVLSSSAVAVAEESNVDTVALDVHRTEVKGAHVDSPETVSSKVVKATLLGKETSESDTQKLSGSPVNVGNDMSKYTEATFLICEERPGSIFPLDGNSLPEGSGSVDINTVGSSHTNPGSNLIDSITAFNRDSAKRASQAFDKFMPTGLARYDTWELDKILFQSSNAMQIKEKLAKHKSFLKFKEQVLAIRYRAAYNLWKEDLHLLSIRKQRPKSQKRFDLSSRLSLSGSQKYRSALRSRVISQAGKPTLVPTTEMINLTGKLLSESQIKIYRNSLKMPACILFEERRHSRFTTNNGMVEDPVSFEKERALINPWTQEEKDLFREMLATFGKDFSRIASFLKHKRTADCIEFYYKNHKSDSFEDVKKRLDLKKQSECLPLNTYLVTSGKKWKRESNPTSLNMLGAAAVVPVRNSNISRVKQIYTRKSNSGGYHEFKVSQRNGPSDRTDNTEIWRHESETAAANVLEAMSSCITSSIDPTQMCHRRIDLASTLEVTQSIDEEETCSDEGCTELDSVDWTDEEKSMFIRALSRYGKDFGQISRCVGSRSREQCKIFFSKARKCLGLDAFHRRPGSGGTLRSDANGESDTEDAYAAEMDSGICSTQSCSKADADFTQSVANTRGEGFVHAGSGSMLIETERSSDHCDAGGSNEDEVETKVGKLALKFNEGSWASEGEKLLSSATPKDVCDVALRCTDSVVIPNPLDKIEIKKETDSPGVSLAEPCSTACMEIEQLKSHTPVEVPQKDSGGNFCADQLEKEVHLLQYLIPKIESENGQQMKIDMDSKASENLPGKVVNDCPCPISSCNYQHQIPCELLPYVNEKSVSLKQDNVFSVPLNSLLPDPSSICFGGHHSACSGSTLDFEKQGNMKQQGSVTREFSQHHMLGNTSLNRVDPPLHVLRGYPLPMLDQREMKKDSNQVSSVLVEDNLKENGISELNRFFLSNSHAEKGDVFRLSQSRSEILCSTRSEEMSDAQRRPCSQSACSENEVQSNRNGDVKLFGKILSHPSSLQKSNLSSCGNNSKLPSLKQGRSSTMKLPSMLKETTVTATMPESSGHSGMEAVPLRSYGFWDGNRIQTGFSKLPESAILLAKCEGSLGGVSMYSAKDGLPCSDGVLVGYQQAYMQELQNGLEMISGLQQQSKAALGYELGGWRGDHRRLWR